MKYERIQKCAAYWTFAIFIMQLLWIIASWILTAFNPAFNIRPILGGEGLRWFFGTFVDNISSCTIVWIILCGMSVGALLKSRLLHAVCSYKQTTRYERMALFVVFWEIMCMALMVVVLAFIPHAILLSALGTIVPSSFSTSIIPMSSFLICFISLTYGYMTGAYISIKSAFEAMCFGVGSVVPFIIAYIFTIEFYCSLAWTLNFE